MRVGERMFWKSLPKCLIARVLILSQEAMYPCYFMYFGVDAFVVIVGNV